MARRDFSHLHTLDLQTMRIQKLKRINKACAWPLSAGSLKPGSVHSVGCRQLTPSPYYENHPYHFAGCQESDKRVCIQQEDKKKIGAELQ